MWGGHRIVTNPTLNGRVGTLPFSAHSSQPCSLLEQGELRPPQGNFKLQVLSGTDLEVCCVHKACVPPLTSTETASKDKLARGRGSTAQHSL